METYIMFLKFEVLVFICLSSGAGKPMWLVHALSWAEAVVELILTRSVQVPWVKDHRADVPRSSMASKYLCLLLHDAACVSTVIAAAAVISILSALNKFGDTPGAWDLHHPRRRQ